jgi:hypothetical protein
MIYEFRTYTLKPRSVPEVFKRFEEKLPERQKFSKLAAMWHTEIGRLNEITHVWGYDSLGAREKIRAEAVKAGAWPPKVGEYIHDMRSEIFIPQPFSPPLEPSNHGPIFEMRSYVMQYGGAAEMSKRWQENLPNRLKLSPLIGVFTSDCGPLNQWVHIWAYKSLEHRTEIRTKAQKEGIWPPPGSSPLVTQETKIMLPAPFSPIR